MSSGPAVRIPGPHGARAALPRSSSAASPAPPAPGPRQSKIRHAFATARNAGPPPPLPPRGPAGPDRGRPRRPGAACRLSGRQGQASRPACGGLTCRRLSAACSGPCPGAPRDPTIPKNGISGDGGGAKLWAAVNGQRWQQSMAGGGGGVKYHASRSCNRFLSRVLACKGHFDLGAAAGDKRKAQHLPTFGLGNGAGDGCAGVRRVTSHFGRCLRPDLQHAALAASFLLASCRIRKSRMLEGARSEQFIKA